ncbi:type I-C CRISPR-associated protein Cas7/Csd2 [Chondromyces apiculatus]|uniref:CRISPR-associated protein, Csd2 family n=1 Tax=Chondromyces apiculatus DSM 436 TaxID=1192034 RepID=A0A017T9P8_9BACT|nr:type I-C CRISPR-associated protein Cas7/Csd2 [Chondromyces apiculatus]EYF05346.1 CRISPR-associated protein, Csd2 family [Chondromyces apiculatus DSM 436]
MSQLQNRYDFVLLFDVKDGNPNGDPDAGNLPRVDPETGHGLVTDVCLKRKVRNYVTLSRPDAEGYDIYVKEKAVLSAQQGRAYAALGLKSAPAAEDDDTPDPEETPAKPAKGAKPAKDAKPAKGPKGKAESGRKASDRDQIDRARDWMCSHFFDIRTFGAVMGLKENNAGQVRGPVQLTFARSIDPILTLEHAITRMAVATQKEADSQGGDNRTMGRKNTVPYGLYRAHGFISPQLARQTGFAEKDLELLWESLRQMFEHDRSAARGLMSLRDLIVFRHESPLGNAPAHRLFDQVHVTRLHADKPPRDFSDYAVRLGDLPAGVTVLRPAA